MREHALNPKQRRRFIATTESVVTNADYYRGLAEDCLFAARQSSAKDVRDACMKDAAYFRALAKRIECRSKTDKSEH